MLHCREVEELRWEQEVLQQKFADVARERDEIQVGNIYANNIYNTSDLKNPCIL